MKFRIVLGIALFCAVGFSGCKRCRTCKYTYSYAGINETVVMEEVCGNKNEVDAYRAQAEAEAEPVNGKVSCVDN